MNRYDIWKTQEPEYLAGNPPCECGHEYDDHEETPGVGWVCDAATYVRPGSNAKPCACTQYEPAEAEQ